jgi:hypothetical protein
MDPILIHTAKVGGSDMILSWMHSRCANKPSQSLFNETAVAAINDL